MRTVNLFFCLVLIFASCAKKENKENNATSHQFSKSINDSTRNYTSSKDITLSINKSTWYTEKINGFGNIYLELSGTTNADKLLMETYGDGLIGYANLDLNANNFNSGKIQISFTHAPTNDFISESTIIKAYKGMDSLIVTIASGQLKY